VGSVQRFEVLHQEKGSAAPDAIVTENETTRSDGRRHLRGHESIEESRQRSVELLDRTSARVARSRHGGHPP